MPANVLWIWHIQVTGVFFSCTRVILSKRTFLHNFSIRIDSIDTLQSQMTANLRVFVNKVNESRLMLLLWKMMRELQLDFCFWHTFRHHKFSGHRDHYGNSQVYDYPCGAQSHMIESFYNICAMCLHITKITRKYFWSIGKKIHLT